MKKAYLTIAILIIALYTAIVLNQYGIVALGEFFGYMFYVIVAAGVIAAIWLLVKPPKKANQ